MATVLGKVQETLSSAAQQLKLSDAGPIQSHQKQSSKATDPTLPGNPDSKTEDLEVAERIGKTPLIWNPFLSRGTNFSFEERWEKHLHGLLPPTVETLQLQSERIMYQIDHEASTDLERYTVMQSLAATNLRLYFYTIIHNLKRLAPIIYTPTVGDACQQFDRIYMNSLGMYFDSFRLRGHFRKLLDNWPSKNVQIIVVTDGGRILGLGDLGANGMGIPIGKISLYIAGGGFHPEHSLPATLDVGTDNEELLNDKFYLGNKKPRLGGDEHMAVVEEFCFAVKDKWPQCLIQFEDFNTERAFAILKQLRDKILCFNDDIQGTAAVVVAGFINSLKAQHTTLKEARVLFFGAGSSAVGVAELIALLLHKDGQMSMEEAYRHIWMMDSKGIITKKRGDKLPPHKQIVARDDDTPPIKDLHDAIRHIKPHALIGLSGHGPAFDKEAVEEMCKIVERPIIMALSNPTSKAEITAENAIKWSHGKAIFASGSPFSPVEYEGRTIEVGQANNVLIFPGVGFGAVMAKAKKVTDEMFLAAARALADYVDQDRLEGGTVYPRLEELRKISATIAAAVVEEAFAVGVAQIQRPNQPVINYIESRMWDPEKPMQAGLE